MSLRARLVVVLVALLFGTTLVVGGAAVLAVRATLDQRLDDQLLAAAGRTSSAVEPRRPGMPDLGEMPGMPGMGEPRDGPDFLLAPGQAQGTLGALVRDGTVVTAAVLDPMGRRVSVSSSATESLADVPAGQPTTVDLGPAYGEYRVLARTTRDGDVVVTGLPRSDVQGTVEQLLVTVVLVATVGLLLAVVVGAWLVRRSLAPLRRVAATATRVSELPLERGEVGLADRVPQADADPTTEVGQVGASLNRLLDHVAAALAARQASETRVRRFVADASHELRTPLAAIRGYAELPRRSGGGTSGDLDPTVAHALGRVESEAIRMTALVDDLLLLARLDEGRPLRREPVDLSRIVVDVAGDARVAAPDHRWDLDLPAEPLVVAGDADALHQVVANLLANARTHTPPGTAVRVVLAPGAGEAASVELGVIDDGPGIAPDLLPEVFERFARGDASRSRSGGSTGLGLAIVQAVVVAHGGTVSVTSRPGRTEFVVRLPSAPG